MQGSSSRDAATGRAIVLLLCVALLLRVAPAAQRSEVAAALYPLDDEVRFSASEGSISLRLIWPIISLSFAFSMAYSVCRCGIRSDVQQYRKLREDIVSLVFATTRSHLVRFMLAIERVLPRSWVGIRSWNEEHHRLPRRSEVRDYYNCVLEC